MVNLNSKINNFKVNIDSDNSPDSDNKGPDSPLFKGILSKRSKK